MSKGISITITRPIETRLPRQGECHHRIWTGQAWVSLSSFPVSPILDYLKGEATTIRTTTLNFLPQGVAPLSAYKYKNGLGKKMRALGVLK